MFRRLFLVAIPKRLLTRVIGQFARNRCSRFLIPWYVARFKINLAEADYQQDFPSLLALFTRRLRAEARWFDPFGFLAPVDGTITAAGPIVPDLALQVKGEPYSLSKLFGQADAAKRYEGGTFMVFYLSPADYHRIHMPTAGMITAWTHVPGRLYPVNRLGMSTVSGLYAKNERVITYIQSALGNYAMVKVGAMGVGTIRTPYAALPIHAARNRRRAPTMGSAQIALERGQEMGWFELGSTVIVLWEPGVVRTLLTQVGERVKVGQRVAVSVHPVQD